MKRKHGGQFLKMIGGLYVLTTAFLYGKQSSYRPFIDISPQPNEGLQDSNRYLKDFKTVEDIIKDIEDTESKETIQLETFFENLTSREDSSTYLTELAQELFDHKDNQNIKAFISQLVTYITNNKKELEKSFDQETIRLLLEGLRNTGTEGNQTVITSQAPINTTDVNFTLPDTGTPTTGTPTTGTPTTGTPTTGTPTTGTPTTGTPTTGTSSLSTVFTDHNTQTTTTISSTDGTTTIAIPKTSTVTHNADGTITVTTTNGNIFTINPESSTITTTGTSAETSAETLAVTSYFSRGTSVSIMPTTNKQDNITTYQVTNTGTPTTGTPTFSTVSTDHNTQTTTISSTDGTTTITFPKANTVTHNKNNTIAVTTTEGKIFTINPQSSTITTTGTSAGTSEFHYKTRTHVFLTSTTPPFIVRKSTTGSQSIEFLLESTSTTPQPQQTFPVTTTQGLDGLFKHTITTHDGSLLIATTSSKELLPISSPQQETSSSLAGSIGGGVAGVVGVLGAVAVTAMYCRYQRARSGRVQQEVDLEMGSVPSNEIQRPSSTGSSLGGDEQVVLAKE